MSHPQELSRRGFFKAAGLFGLAAAMPQPALAAKVDDEIAKRMGSGSLMASKVTLETPIIAENGAVVPVKVIVDHPMNADDYIASIGIFVDNNPNTFGALYKLSPKSGKAQVATRLKIGKTSKVRAVAKTNRGEMFMAVNEVKVTIGGCGG